MEPGPFRTDWAGRSVKQTRNEIKDYAATSGANRQRITASSGQQPGDPARAATAIIEAVLSDNPPLRLVLGQWALDAAYAKLDQVSRELDAWEQVARNADFPQEAVHAASDR